MKFRRRAGGVAREEVFLNLTSLIDVIFVLLLFFVVTTTFSRPSQLKIDLPEASSGTPPEASAQKQLEVLVGADGQYEVNGQLLLNSDLDSLMAALQRESADAKTPHQAFITAMDAAGKLGFAHLRITTVEAQAAP